MLNQVPPHQLCLIPRPADGIQCQVLLLSCLQITFPKLCTIPHIAQSSHITKFYLSLVNQRSGALFTKSGSRSCVWGKWKGG